MGLSAEELSAETLYPGDTIEYFSMAFVNGDPRGHRVAKVLQVLRDEPEYPLRLESQEMLPLTLMVRRKRDRHDDEIDPALAKWRKIRTFKLVVGEVKGRTRADRLNDGLKQSMADAIQAAKAAFAAQTGDRNQQCLDGDDDNNRKIKMEQQAARKPAKVPKLQQQKLSFAKRVSSDASSERSSDLVLYKRSSLDSMSKRLSPSQLARRPRDDEPPVALKRKKPRPQPSLPRKPAPHDSPHSLKAGGDKRPLHKSKYFATTEQRKPQQKKLELIKFVDHLEEKKASRATTLNEYLALDEKQKSAFEAFARPPSSLDKRGAKQEQVSNWLAGGNRKKSEPVTPPGPPKRQSLGQPRAVPDKHKSPLTSRLSFVMPTSAGETSSGSSQSSSRAEKKVKVRSGRENADSDDDGGERHRKRKHSSDFSSPVQRSNKISERRDRQPNGRAMNHWMQRK